MKQVVTSLIFGMVATSALAGGNFPGSMWAEVSTSPVQPGSTETSTNVQLSGNINQGIRITSIGSWGVVSYVAVSYSADRSGEPYNNKVAPALGIKLVRTYEGANAEMGARYIQEHRSNGQRGAAVQLYVNAWSGWNLGK